MQTTLGAFAAAVALAWFACAHAAATVPQPPAFRLPDGARPVRYEATLTVVPGEPRAAGEITIDVAMTRPHDVLWLNAEALDVTRAAVASGDTRIRVLSGHEPFVGLAFDPPLPSGLHRLTLTFEAGQSRNSTQGIFALQDGGAWYAMTQFEPTHARRAFPCFDEPGFKVPWTLWLRVPRALVALSNAPVVSETDVGDGMKLVRFAETRPLPSYLVAFAVGPWDVVDVGSFGMRPTPMRIAAARGRASDAAFAAREYPRLFERMERWFGIAHPYPKLDHVAIPLTVPFAMENAGLITYGAPNLLAKGEPPDARFRRRAAGIGAHEMAHQWFGNLVTMAWWDDLWLNEAFATWFAGKIVGQWRPEHRSDAWRVRERAEAIAADTLSSARRIREPIVSRGDIYNAFDAITYQKGATVIDMFEQWIGEEPFRDGVRRYLQTRSDGNATTADFLSALAAASGRTIEPAFASFLDQNGVPQIGVALACDRRGARVVLSQRRLTPLGAAGGGGQRWRIPVCVRYGKGRAAARQTCALVTETSETLPLEGACPDFVYANAGGRGYFVPDHQGMLLARLAAHRDALTPAEFASLLYDLRALLGAGAVDAARAADWVRAGAASPDPHVVEAAIDLAAYIRDTLTDEDERPRYAAFVREVFGPRMKTLGLAPAANESDGDALLRRSLVGFAAAEDPALAAEARRLAAAWLRDRRAIDPGLADSVLLAAGQSGDAALFDAMVAEVRAPGTEPLDRRHLLVALFAFRDPTLAKKGLDLLLDGTLDIRESTTALSIAHRAAASRRETHDFIVANYDALARRVPRDAPGRWPGYAAGLCSERDRTEVLAFWQPRIASLAGGERNLAQAAETIERCVAVRSKHRRDGGASAATPSPQAARRSSAPVRRSSPD